MSSLKAELLVVDAAGNDTSWKNLRFNRPLAAARPELNRTKRAAIYAEMQERMAEQGSVMVLTFYNHIGAPTD